MFVSQLNLIRNKFARLSLLQLLILPDGRWERGFSLVLDAALPEMEGI